MTAPDTNRTALYRIYSGAVLLYVGITDDPERRWYQHSREKPWWPEVTRKTVEWLPSRAEALTAEEAVIKAELPRHNGTWSPLRKRSAVALASDGVQEVSLTVARSLLTETVRQAREDDMVSAFTVRDRRRAYLVTPDFYDQAIADRARLESLDKS